MPRSSRPGELIYGPEVKKTARRLKQETKKYKEGHFFVAFPDFNMAIELSTDYSSDLEQKEYIMANNRTLRALAAPDLTQQPLCITFLNLNENTFFELKFGLIHLLPSFHGLSGKKPHKHLQEFDVVCSSMNPPESLRSK